MVASKPYKYASKCADFGIESGFLNPVYEIKQTNQETSLKHEKAI
jgi:hypothetical protein